MNLLFISFSAPPVADSQSIRNAYFMRGLVEAGFKVTLLTGPADGGDPTLIALIPSSVLIKRTGMCFYDQIQNLISNGLRGKVRSWVKSFVATLAGRILVPDVRPDWQRMAARLSDELFAESRYDIVVSSSGSFAAHEVAAKLAQKYSVSWVAEYGDPWALNPLPPLSLPKIKKRNLKIESRLLTVCRGMTVTTEETADLYRKWLGEACPPIEVITCGFSRRGLANHRKSNCLLISYVGTASRGNRDLRDFMQLCDDLLKKRRDLNIRFQVVGAFSPTFLSMARSLRFLKTEFLSWVPYFKSIEIMEESDILLLYGNSAPIQVPGKLFNYLSTGRPVIYYGKLPKVNDPCLKYLLNHGAVRCFGPERPLTLKELEILLDGHKIWASDAKSSLDNNQFFSLFSWDSVSKRFAEFVKNRI